jgi:uncharacterized repeat protein (TIGR01451 family)
LFYSANSALLTLTNATLSGNVAEGATASGGNLFANNGLIENTIVAGGAGSAGTENCGQNGVSAGHNLDSRDQCGFHAGGDQVNKDPLLGPLQDNGGGIGTQAINAGSPAFNAGDNNGCPATDERGIVRPQAGTCDIGAFELETADLALANVASAAKRPPGTRVTFSLTVNNAGASTAQATALTDKLPSRLGLISATPSAGSCSGSRTVSCSLGDVGAGGSAKVTIVARTKKRGTAVNRASVTSSIFDSNAANNSANASVVVGGLVLSGARIKPRTFHRGSRRPRLTHVRTGTTIRFRLPESASVKLSFARQGPGRRAGKRCVAPSPRNLHGKRCKRFAAAGSFKVRARSGRNRIRFSGRLSRRKALRPGRYGLRISARDKYGNRSRAKSLRFRLLPALRRR